MLWFLNSVLAGLYLITLVLAYDTKEICKDAPMGALRCCDSNNWTRCWGPHSKPPCKPVPFAGTCQNNKLNITHQENVDAYFPIRHLGINRDELADPDSIPSSVFATAKTIGPFPILKLSKRGAHKTTKNAKQMLPTKVQKNLGLSNVPQTSGPPKACQVVGNVVFDRCDYYEAIFDHWLGDDPCDYGCPTSQT